MDQIADRQEIFTTDENINAIRAIDVSGQNGEAVIISYSPRRLALLFSSGEVGKGFSFKVDLYTNSNTVGDNAASSKTISLIWIAFSAIFGIISFTRKF